MYEFSNFKNVSCCDHLICVCVYYVISNMNQLNVIDYQLGLPH